MIAPFAGMWVASDNSRWLSGLVQRTFRRMELSRKAQEEYTGLSEKQISDQLTLKHPLNLWRLADIPEFFFSFMHILADEFGFVLCPKDQVMYVPLEDLLAYVEAKPRPMLKASLPAPRMKESA